MSDPLERGSTEHYADANYYDYTYRRRVEDVAWYRRVARQHGGPILELGGGSGRVGLALLADGHEVTLLEKSKTMLDRARERSLALPAEQRRRLRFVHADMREFALRRRFGLVLAPFNTLLHLYAPADFEKCFRCVARHLAPRGGRFAFDVRVPHLGELNRNPERWYRARPFKHPTLGYKVEYRERFYYDSIAQVQHVTMAFAPAKGAPRGSRPFEVLLTQRQVFPAELRGLLALGGLALESRHGDFTGRPLSPEDTQSAVVAKLAPSRRA